LVRHGRTDLNDGVRLLGRTDARLSAQGQQDALVPATLLAALGPAVDAIHSSPLLRASQTADLIGGALKVPVQVVPALMELDFGDLEGQDLSQWPEQAQIWKSNPEAFAPPGGESITDLGRRVAGFVRGLPGDRDQILVGHLFAHLFGACVLVGLPPAAFRSIFLAPGGILELARGPRGEFALQGLFNPGQPPRRLT
jgi:broad specificity phosphatase PhoE